MKQTELVCYGLFCYFIAAEMKHEFGLPDPVRVQDVLYVPVALTIRNAAKPVRSVPPLPALATDPRPNELLGAAE